MGTNKRLGVKKRKANGRNGFLALSLFVLVIFPLGDVVPGPRQSLDPSSRGTTSPDPAGHSAGRTSAMKNLHTESNFSLTDAGRLFCDDFRGESEEPFL